LALEADKFTAICEAVFYKCGINNSQPYRHRALGAEITSLTYGLMGWYSAQIAATHFLHLPGGSNDISITILLESEANMSEQWNMLQPEKNLRSVPQSDLVKRKTENMSLQPATIMGYRKSNNLFLIVTKSRSVR
jgi:hypothetical protein